MRKLLNTLKSRKRLFILIFILVLAFVIRFIPYTQEGLYGFDSYVHYSIVEQALENKELPIRNDLDNCPSGLLMGVPYRALGHPLGFYLTPFILGKFINLNLAFALSSVLFGIATILLVYLLFKRVFNWRVAAIGALFLAISFAHVFKSNAINFRGENFFIVPLLLSLIFGLRFLTENRIRKKLIYASLAAFFSASSAFFWPGYPYALIVYALSLTLFILYDFIIKGKTRNVPFAILSLFLQFVFVYVITKFSYTYTAEQPFLIYYPIFVLLISLFLGSLFVFSRYFRGARSRVFFVGAFVLAGAVFALIKKELIVQLATGFGLIVPTTVFNETIIELQPITYQFLLDQLWFIPLFSILGLAIMIFKLDNKRAFLLGAVIPSMYLLTTTLRFVFLGSILFVPLVGVVFDSLRNINRKVFYGGLLVIFVFASINGIGLTNSTLSPDVDEDMIKSFEYFRENTPNNSCLITFPSWGGMIQYFAKRSSYISSTNQNLKRLDKLNRFFLTNETFKLEEFDADLNEAYIGFFPTDFRRISNLAKISEIQGLSYDLMILVDRITGEGYEENVYEAGSEIYKAVSLGDSISVYSVKNGNPIFIKTVFLETRGKVKKIINEAAEDEGCVYLSNFVTAYFNEKLCNTNMVKMLVQQEIEGLEHWYSHENIRIYKIA